MGWIKIAASVTGTQEQVSRIQGASTKSVDNLRVAMAQSAKDMQAQILSRIQSSFKRRSGKMERSTYGFVKESSDHTVFTGIAGVSKRAYYAKFQEKGANQAGAKVKGYTRHVQGGDVRSGRKKVAMGVGFVGSYERDIHLNAKHFIRSAYDQLIDRILHSIEGAIRGSQL